MSDARAPRRPPGWTAPGPRPRGDQGDPTLAPADDEDLSLLTGDWRVFQKRRGNRWSLDDLVTAWIATESVDRAQVRRALDLGCGIGSVLMMVAWRIPHVRSVGVEAQAVSAGLARRALRWNGADDRCEVRDGDLRAVLDHVPEGAVFDLVTGTPPYFPPGTGVESSRVQVAPARFEHRGGIEDYCLAASKTLGAGGRFVVCGGAMEGPRAHAGARDAGLVVLADWAVIPRVDRPMRVGVWVMARASDFAETPPCEARSITVRTADGQWTTEFRAVRDAMGMPSSPP